MQISVAKKNSIDIFLPMKVGEFDSMDAIIKQFTYSCSVFKENKRLAVNFLQAECMALDFDDGMSLADALVEFKDYKHIIGTTRNHQKDKKGKTCDRFRVILFLSEPIKDKDVYKATYNSLLAKYWMADKATKDPARMFYPCETIESSAMEGETINPVTTTPTPIPRDIEVTMTEGLDFSSKPEGWSNCVWSIANGYFESGQGNEMMMALATNLKKLRYNKDQAYSICKSALRKRKERTGAEFDKSDMYIEVINQVYADTWTGAVYVCSEPDTKLHDYCCSLGVNACKTKDTVFNFTTIDQLFKTKSEVNWRVDNLLTAGGMSIIVGVPKSGKSTLVRQLALAVSRGDKFLGRQTRQGKVLYLALEEEPEMLAKQFKMQGAMNNDDIYFHVGSAYSVDPIADLEDQIIKLNPDLLIVDTLLLLANVESSNSYDEMNKTLARLRKIARDNKVHIVNVHHQNKPAPGTTQNRGANSILGSSAIHGAMDCILVFNKIGRRRVLNAEGRGIKQFQSQGLEFDEKSLTYELGVVDEEF